MSNKSNNQSNSLDSIKFVKDIDPQTAANYSGGEGRVNGAAFDPDVILHQHSGFEGERPHLNAAIGDGISNLKNHPGNFNDRTSSIRVERGKWEFFTDKDYRGESTGVLSLGWYELPDRFNDKITSAKRVG